MRILMGALFYGLNQPAFLVGNWYTASLMFIWVNFYIVAFFYVLFVDIFQKR